MITFSQDMLQRAQECIDHGNLAVPVGKVTAEQGMVKVGYIVGAGLFCIAAAIANHTEKTTSGGGA